MSPPPTQVLESVSVEFNFLHTGFAMYSSMQEPDAAAVPTAEPDATVPDHRPPDATTPVPDHPPSEEPQETVINLVKQATSGKVVEGLGEELSARLTKKQCITNRAPRYLCAGTLQSLPSDIWLEIVDHSGRRDALRRTCRKLMAIIPPFYCAKVTGSVDLVLFTEFLCSRVAHHLYGVDVCMTRQAERAWIRDERPMSDEEWADFCTASSACVAALARCADLHVLRMHIPTTEPATVAQLPVRTLDFIWPRSSKRQKTGTGRQVSALWPSGLSTALALLKGSTTLQTLDLHLRGYTSRKHCRRHIGEAHAQALAMLKESRTLRTLELHLRGNQMRDAGAQTLAQLNESETLQTLHLSICFNQIGDAGARALATLKESNTLQTFYLDLSDNHIGDAGAQALATLKESKAIETLHLSLCFNRIGDAGAEALATLKESKTLQTLYLNLADNKITDFGAQAVATLMESSTFQTLNLDLARNRIEDAGALLRLQQSSYIRDLHLPLSYLYKGPRMSATIPIDHPKCTYYTNIHTGEIIYDTTDSDTDTDTDGASE